MDRGRQSVECVVIILGFMLLHPHAVHINRGNHEDSLVNKRYGLVKEVMNKYGTRTPQVLAALGAIFAALPLVPAQNDNFNL